MQKRKIMSAWDVPCPLCGAQPDERCNPDPYPAPNGFHPDRVWDANDAQVAVEALTR